MSTEHHPRPARERLKRARGYAAERLRRARRVLTRGPQPGARPRPPETEAARSHKALYWTGGALAALLALLAVFLLVFDWNWMRGPLSRYASARMHREVAITGDLEVHPWSWRPSAIVNGIQIANPAWAGPRRMADIEKLSVQIRLLPLLRGDVDLLLLGIERPRVSLVRDRQGRANWDFSDGRQVAEPLRLPPIRRFLITDGRLRYADAKRDLEFDGLINASERLGAGARGFELVGKGALNQAPFKLEVIGGPLLNIDRNKPYPFDATLRAGATLVTAKGAVPKPFDLGHLYMNMRAQGNDLADLYDLTGAPLPNTPPYRLSARFTRDDQLYQFEKLAGRVGDSDLAGRLSVDRSRARALLSADLRSRSLDFDDLAAVFGGAPKTGPGETASPVQKAVSQKMVAQQRMLPDATLKVDRLRAMDARVAYRADSVRDSPVKLRSAAVKLALDDGLLRANPVAFELSKGRLAGWVTLNARQATPVTDLDLRLTGARLEQLVPAQGSGPPLTGTLLARAKLHGAGASVHRAAAAADGQVLVVVPGGEIRKAFAELMGVNVTKGLGLLLSKDESTTPIRCGVAQFQAKDGVLTANRIVFDTGPVLATGKGTVNLGSERMAFRFEGHPKKARLVRLMAPITVKGPLSGPKVGLDADGAIAQGGLAAVLGVAATPLAAILPFIDLGLEKDAACGQLIAEAAQHGAPTKVAKK